MNKREASIGIAAFLIVVGWFLPWGSAGAGDVNGLTDSLHLWFRLMILGVGILGLLGTAFLVIGQRAVAVGFHLVAALVGVALSTVVPATIFLAARNLAGYGDSNANVGPNVTHGIGAFALAVGFVAMTLGCGLSLRRKPAAIALVIVGILEAVLLVIGLA